MLYIGDEVQQNYAEAFELFTELAERNHAWAQYHLGDMYRYGHGTDKNEVCGFLVACPALR